MMIGSLRGNVLERSSDGTALVEVAGVGYVVHVTPRCLAELEPTSPAFLYVHHHIREEAQTLFGFLSRDEKTTFQTLIATHGVGPSLALAILSTHSPSTLVDIVASSDVGALTLVPGVGKKTAERLLVELKNRLSLPTLPDPDTNIGAGTTVSDVREALMGLGYSESEIREALRSLPTETDAATMLREALRLLGVRRA
jgi:Holliday junction DNA helicase RuvA